MSLTKQDAMASWVSVHFQMSWVDGEPRGRHFDGERSTEDCLDRLELRVVVKLMEEQFEVTRNLLRHFIWSQRRCQTRRGGAT
jgi:hypothetical protein